MFPDILKKFCISKHLFAHGYIDDKGEVAPETGLRNRHAGQSVRREERQQPAAAGGRREGAASHRPQHRRQELQQEKHL